MTNRKDLPSEKASNFQQRLRETVMTYLGKQGDPLDRGVTLRDLISSGLAKLPTGWRGGSEVAPLRPGDAVATPEDIGLDLTPPPMPTGVSVTAAISNLMISTDSPAYQAGHESTVVYGKTYVEGDALPTFATAVKLTEFPGAIGSYATNPATTWHIWVSWKSKAGIEGLPAGGTNGFVVTTGQDVALLLDALNGQITQSQLYSDLGSRIDLIDGPQSMAGSVAARIFSEQQARVAAITAEQQARTRALLAEAAARDTAISNETTQRITATGALQSQINLLSAASSGDFTELLSAVQEEQTARIEGDLAEAAQRTTLAAQHVTLAEVVAHGAELDEVNRLGNEVLVTAERVRASASLDVERIVRANADGALSTQITNLNASFNTTAATLQASITQEATARANADEAVSSTLTALITQTGTEATAAITAEQQARTTAISAETSARNAQVATLQTADSNLSAAIVSEATLRLADDAALGQRIDSLGVEVDGNAAAIINEATARANSDGALAQSINQVQARLDTGDYAAVKVQAQATATSLGNLTAEYTVKLDAGGKVSGFGLFASSDAPSLFAVRADKFYIAPPATGGGSATEIMPFIVQASATTIGGVSVPAGVYINDAYIRNGTISNAKIANASIDDAKITTLSVGKLTAGSIMSGQFIQSSNYVAGSSGFRINANGYAEFGNATVRGTINSSTINSSTINSSTINSATINGSNVNITGFNGGWGYVRSNTKWWFDSQDGWVLARNSSDGSTFFEFKSGSNFVRFGAGGGTNGYCAINFPKFSVDSSGNATFGGTLSAQAVNAVNTIHIAGEAVSRVRFVRRYWSTTLTSAYSEAYLLEYDFFVPYGVGTTSVTIHADTPMYVSTGNSVAVALRIYIDGSLYTEIGATADGNSHMISASCAAQYVTEGYHRISIRMSEISPWVGSKPLSGILSLTVHGALR